MGCTLTRSGVFIADFFAMKKTHTNMQYGTYILMPTRDSYVGFCGSFGKTSLTL